jgi:hypothetical protein
MLLTQCVERSGATLRGKDGRESAVVAVESDKEETAGTVNWYCPFSIQHLRQ